MTHQFHARRNKSYRLFKRLNTFVRVCPGQLQKGYYFQVLSVVFKFFNIVFKMSPLSLSDIIYGIKTLHTYEFLTVTFLIKQSLMTILG